MCLGVFLFGFILYGILAPSWTWVAVSFLVLGKLLTIISSNILSWHFFLPSSGAPMIRMLGCLTLSQRSHFFLFILLCFSYFHHSIFWLTYPFFCLRYPTVHSLEWFSVQFSSVTQSCPTLCNPMNCSMAGLPVYHQFLKFTQTHVHRVSDTIQPSHPLSSPSPPSPNPSQHQGLFQWVNSSHEVAKILEFQLQHQSFQWIPRTDLL